MTAETAIKAAVQTTTATLRDLALKCQVRKFVGQYFLVTNERGETYRVECWYRNGDFDAHCQCPIRTFRKRQCRHELSVIMHERNRVANQQFAA
jgi:hypothetical protein